MCGIAGFFLHANHKLQRQRLDAVASHMGRAIAHRGPDAASSWTDASRVGLAHQRLSIIDLSAAGTQPMQSACGDWVVVYNGECYNFEALRKQLQETDTIAWRSATDTEVVVEVIARVGFAAALEAINGMFALAAYHRPSGRLYLARDRAGQKPLYWGRTQEGFVFGSELRALMAFPGFDKQIDAGNIANYFQLGYFYRDTSVFRNTWKLLPGTWMAIDAHGRVEHHAYWQLDKLAAQSAAARATAAPAAELRPLLQNAVAARLVADVPVGCLLSGGIDSSLVAALATAANTDSKQVHTFCVGFDEQGYDESSYAAAVAEQLGTTHVGFKLRPDEALAHVEELPDIYDEPFADSSQLPTYLVSRCARQYVKVVLSGDGGDEFFLGYTRYFRIASYLRRTRAYPGAARAAASQLAQVLAYTANRTGLGGHYGDRLLRFSTRLGAADDLGAYWQSVALTPRAERFVHDARGGAELPDLLQPDDASSLRQFALLDQLTYLPEDILCKVDRASMAVGLEARNPLLDHRILAYSWQLSEQQHLGPYGPKSPLKKVLFDMLPQSLFQRPKAGFGVPIAAWLRGPLRSWAEPLILERTRALEDKSLDRCWRQFLNGADSYERLIWALLMLKAWARRYQVEL